MDEAQLAGLKRKYEVTQEPAKKNELRALLVRAGVDPDKAEATSKPYKAPSGRQAKPLVTAEQAKPVEKVAETPETKTSSEDKPSRRPGRPRKSETTK